MLRLRRNDHTLSNIKTLRVLMLRLRRNDHTSSSLLAFGSSNGLKPVLRLLPLIIKSDIKKKSPKRPYIVESPRLRLVERTKACPPVAPINYLKRYKKKSPKRPYGLRVAFVERAKACPPVAPIN